MEFTPSQLTNATFRTVRKGYDPDEVEAFLEQAASALELAQQQATAMEARARAAVARLQEAAAAAEQAKADPTPAATPHAEVDAEDAETITRTLLLAQRTADTTIAEARAEADRLIGEARAEAETTIDSTREMSARLLEEAKAEARAVSESERQAAHNEVQALVARREFLVGDVEQLEQFLEEQRERLRAAARQIEALCERVPAGLGEVRRPVLSASADDDSGAAVATTDAATRTATATSVGERADDATADTGHDPYDDLPPTEPHPTIDAAGDADEAADDGGDVDDRDAAAADIDADDVDDGAGDDGEDDETATEPAGDTDTGPRQTVLIDDLRQPD